MSRTQEIEKIKEIKGMISSCESPSDAQMLLTSAFSEYLMKALCAVNEHNSGDVEVDSVFDLVMEHIETMMELMVTEFKNEKQSFLNMAFSLEGATNEQ